MDKQFWASVAENDYKIPAEHTLAELTRAIFGYLASTDPVLRDDIAYAVYANWLKQEKYTREDVSEHVEELLDNLEKGIGERESNSVFLRAFSILFLAEIVHNDNKKPFLEKAQVKSILAKGLWYLDAEKDPRGYVPVKGWTHALAHTADLMLVLACNRHLSDGDLQKILSAISAKIVHAANYLYIHGEDERLASAVIEVFRRGLLPVEEVRSWATSFAAPDEGQWKGAYIEETKNRAFQNTRNLLRSIYLELITNKEDIPHCEALQAIFLNALKDLKPY